MKAPYFMVMFAAVLWGTTGTAQTFIPASHPISVGAVRLAVGGIFLFVAALAMNKLRFRGLHTKYVLGAAISMACYQPFFFSAVSLTGVAVGTVVGIGSAPVMAGLIDWLFMKRRKSRRWWMATSLSIIGCGMLFLNSEEITVDPLGILLALGAGLSFAAYTLISEKLVKNHSPITVVAVVFILSAIILSPFLFVFDSSWMASVNGVLVSLHLGILATGVAYVLFSKGLIKMPGSTAVTLSLAEPLTAALLGVFVVGEVFSLVSWIGMALILCGLWVLSISSPEKSRVQAA
ncbi:EamA family transporter [Halobacillus sp. A1]|uniref:EamA family transporter n=1 Tax=Halobacillus sp. A1 TaxID=2880262 RepID=UPI0020A65065|nr:EamA family transporter [Halobacillus sp. A1]MCP3030870.1 EamA family transporter [Halobacillus sp. A1]